MEGMKGDVGGVVGVDVDVDVFDVFVNDAK